MLVELARSFEFARRWYRGEPVRALALQYYFVLRSVLARRPELRRYLVRCRHCRILFLGDPRNAGREDLGCPFGCAEAHRRRRSSERGTAYNRTAVGKEKRRRRREEAQRSAGGPECPGVAEVATLAGGQGEEPPAAPLARANDAPGGSQSSARGEEAPSNPLAEGQAPVSAACPSGEEVALEEGILEYVRIVVSLIEERRVMREEVLEMLRRTRRQHSLVRERRIHYVVRSLDEDPP